MTLVQMIGSSLTITIMSLTGLPAAAQSVDQEAALATLKANRCATCHALERKKDGPPYREIADKYKGKANAEETLFRHMTTTPMVKIDGVEEEHKATKATNDAEIMNVVRYILSR